MSLALFAMIQELKAEVAVLQARIIALELRDVRQPVPEPKPEPPRPTLSLSKRA